MANILDGKAVSAKLRQQIKDEITARNQAGIRPPGLAVILVGDNPASEIYVRNKQKACAEVGIDSKTHLLSATTSQQTLLDLISKLNDDEAVDGILVQSPLPDHLCENDIIEHIHADKDVDCFHPYNVGRLATRRPLLRPCTPYGVITLLEHFDLPIKGVNAVVVGASNIVGRPMAMELLLAGASVSVCHKFTEDLPGYVKHADLLISAVGKPHLIQGEWIREGAVVVDVGINRLPNGKLTGDVDFEVAKERASWITPVPGGVGPMTIATLMRNALFAAKVLHAQKD